MLRTSRFTACSADLAVWVQLLLALFNQAGY